MMKKSIDNPLSEPIYIEDSLYECIGDYDFFVNSTIFDNYWGELNILNELLYL